MNDRNPSAVPDRPAWNKGKLTGPKPPLRQGHVWAAPGQCNWVDYGGLRRCVVFVAHQERDVSGRSGARVPLTRWRDSCAPKA